MKTFVRHEGRHDRIQWIQRIDSTKLVIFIYMQYKFHLNNNIDKATKSPTYKLPSKMVVYARVIFLRMRRISTHVFVGKVITSMIVKHHQTWIIIVIKHGRRHNHNWHRLLRQ